MKSDLRPNRPFDESAARAVTGRTVREWFVFLDALGGPAKGRREMGNPLYGEHKVDPRWSSAVDIEHEAARGLCEMDGRAKGHTIGATHSIKADPQSCCDAFASSAALGRSLGHGHPLGWATKAAWPTRTAPTPP